jgi:hypothetical protein
MDPGIYVFAAFVSVPIFLLLYAMGYRLKKEWRQTREQEKTAERPGLDRKLNRLLQRAAAQELALEESTQRLEQQADELDRVREEHGRRLENLEAVVVGQVWNEVETPGPVQTGGLPRPARLARRLDR